MALEPVSQAFLAQLAEAGDPPIHESTPAVNRLSGAGPEVGQVRDLKLDGEGGQFRVRVLLPGGEPEATIVYFHGGGWMLGDIDLQYDHLGRVLANLTRSAVVLVNYRKAPEHPFPAAVEDSWRGLTWVAPSRATASAEWPGGPRMASPLHEIIAWAPRTRPAGRRFAAGPPTGSTGCSAATRSPTGHRPDRRSPGCPPTRC